MKRYYIFAGLLCFSSICSNWDDEIGLVIDPETSRDGKGIDHLLPINETKQGTDVAGASGGIGDDLTSSIAPRRHPMNKFATGPADIKK